MKRFLVLLCALTLVFGVVGIAGATVIDFEDLYPGYETDGPIPAGYAGFNWSPSSYWMTKYDYANTGFEYGTIGSVSLFPAHAGVISMSIDVGNFDFIGAYITSAYHGYYDVTVQGWRDNVLVDSTTIKPSCYPANWFDFDYQDIDTIVFIPQHHIAIDDITYIAAAPIPEPTTMLLFGSGLIGLVGFRKKFKK